MIMTEEQKNPKARRKTTNKRAPKKKTEDSKRFLNVGVNVELSIGDYVVKELSAFELLDLVSKSLELLLHLQLLGEESQDELRILAHILMSDELKPKLRHIFAVFCREENEELFDNLSITDVKKLVNAIKEVTDFEEIRELFLALRTQ
jgi:hypothetical protein